MVMDSARRNLWGRAQRGVDKIGKVCLGERVESGKFERVEVRGRGPLLEFPPLLMLLPAIFVSLRLEGKRS